VSGSPRAGAHPIEVRSYAVLRSRLDVSDLPPLSRAVVERIVHTTADPTWAGDLVCDEDALRAGRTALLRGAPLVTDVRMVAAGITARPSVVALDLVADPDPDPAAAGAAPGSAGRAELPAPTRCAAGIREAVRRHPGGAVWAIGNAPTALAALVACARAGLVSAPLVVGLPVGFVGAVAAKAALRASGLGAVSSRSERGGAAVAAAAVNALLYAGDVGDLGDTG